jgi:hypothetical protein
MVIALRPRIPKHIRDSWSHYTDTSQPVDVNRAQYMVTVQSVFWTRDLLIIGTTRLPTALTGPTLFYLPGGEQYTRKVTTETHERERCNQETIWGLWHSVSPLPHFY